MTPPGPAPAHRALLLTGALTALALLLLAVPGNAAATTPLRFSKPVFVSGTLAGGEPFVTRTPQGTLVYSSHEGTTHIFRKGLAEAPIAVVGLAAAYRNQVNVFVSTDNGTSWKPVNFLAGFVNSPAIDSGFSDPDLTLDEGGTIYDTGINLVNDSLFSSRDGGRTWGTGTLDCTEGDRPWLAGGKAGTVYLSTDLETNGDHAIFVSHNYGKSCSTSYVTDNGSTPDGGTYEGQGKLFYDHSDGSLIEPIIYYSKTGTPDGVGIGRMKAGTSSFVDHEVAKTTLYAHWPALAVDDHGGYYLVWDTDNRKMDSGGCSGTGTALANTVQMTYSRDRGTSWATPITVARPSTRVLWPWITVGSPGRVGVIWYSYNEVLDPDCATTGELSAKSAIYPDLFHSAGTVYTADVFGRAIHSGGTCQGGTDCVASGKDRRLGDFFTDAVDSTNGCLMVASGDTTRTDALTHKTLPISLPLFAEERSGPSLISGKTCAQAASPPKVVKPGRTTTAPSTTDGSKGTAAHAGGRSLASTGLTTGLPISAFVLLVAAGVFTRRTAHSRT